MIWFRRITLGIVGLLAVTIFLLWFISAGEPVVWFMDGQIRQFGQSAAEKAWTNEDSTAKISLDFTPYRSAMDALGDERLAEIEQAIAGQTIPQLQTLMAAGDLSSEELLLAYLVRIERYDVDQLNSVLALNPTALTDARLLDAERAAGRTMGLLFGIPVLIKDMVAVQGMPTTAGAVALADMDTAQDAFVVEQLRAEGAIILGKANLSEWGFFLSEKAPSGFTALGGHTRNPYGRFDVGGSSSGSAAAVAANLTTVAVGTETEGSLTNPAGQNAIYALKPSIGLLSRNGVMPLSPEVDTVGPMARTVTDLAILFTAMAAPDPTDSPNSQVENLAAEDFTNYLSLDGLSGVRIGIMANQIPLYARPLVAEMRKALEMGGATVIDVTYEDSLLAIYFSSVSGKELMAAGMQKALPTYLDAYAENSTVTSVADIVSYNEKNPTARVPYGQSLLTQATENRLSIAEYQTRMTDLRSRKQAAIRRTLATGELDFLLSVGGLFSPEYAPAGFPALAIPAGYLPSGEPIGVTLVGDSLSDGRLIAAAYALEQNVSFRKAPDLESRHR